jgi:NADPH:quinone reductase
MQRLRLIERAQTAEGIRLPVERCATPEPGPGDVLVEIQAAAVNPSDAKAALGAMAHAAWPRTPGRDWSGVVAKGPQDLVGQAVFGSGGDLGITRDGTHASHVVLPAEAIVQRPDRISPSEAGALGIPFVTAWEGYRRAGMPTADEVVLILAVNGHVGRAAAQIAAMLGARVFGVTRRAEAFAGPAAAAVTMIDASAAEVAATVRAATGGHGADIAFNTVGSPYFAAANQAMAHGGRQILISTAERSVPFDVFAFYRGRHTFVGIDTLALDCRASASALRAMLPGFTSGALQAFPATSDASYRLADAASAYRRVLSGTRERVILLPG